MFDIALERPKSSQGHYLKNLDITQVADAKYQVSRPSVNGFQRRRYSKDFNYLLAWPPCRSFEQNFVLSAPEGFT